MVAIDSWTFESLKSPYLEVLQDINRLLLRDVPVDELCEEVFAKLQSGVQLDAYFLFRVAADGTRLELVSCRGCPPERRNEVAFLEFGQAVCGTVATTQRPMYVPQLTVCRSLRCAAGN